MVKKKKALLLLMQEANNKSRKNNWTLLTRKTKLQAKIKNNKL